MPRISIDFKSKKLKSICKQFNVNRLYVFGSAAKGEMMDSSDIDLIVEFDRSNYHGAFDQFMGFKEMLEDLYNRPVDLLASKKFRNHIFEREVEDSKVLVYAAQN